MEKFKLNFSELKVESFETGAVKTENGTVKGHQEKCNAASTTPPTIKLTCYHTCATCTIPSEHDTCRNSCILMCELPY